MSQTKLSDEGINIKLLKLLNTGCKLLKKQKASKDRRCTSKPAAKTGLDKARLSSIRLSNQERLFQQRYQQAQSKLKMCQYQLTRIHSHLYQTSGTQKISMQQFKVHF